MTTYFPCEKLSPALRRGGDSGFDVYHSLEAPPWKSHGSASPVEERLGERLKFRGMDVEEVRTLSLLFFFFLVCFYLFLSFPRCEV
jgi:hypothetical protein